MIWYLPQYRSQASGNCLYSSVSLALVGDNCLVSDLQVLTSIEFYLKADFYSQHPYFSSAHAKHREKVSQSFKNLLPMSVSNRALDFGFSGDQLVKKEAILNCCDKTWSSFLCILGLASVTNRNIYCYYPDCGEQRFRLLFNCKVEPCPPLRAISDLHVLFCFHGIVESGKVFQPNHFVPLVFDDKPAGGEKRKLPAQKVSPNQQKSKSKKTSSVNLVQSKISFPSFVSAPDPKPCQDTDTKIPTCISSPDPLTGLQVSGKTAPLATNLPSTSSTITTCTSQIHFMHEYDIATYREKAKSMTDLEICVPIKNVFKPDKTYSFPTTNGRSFRFEWLELYPWLCYSSSQDGAYCLPSVLFGDRFPEKALKKNTAKNVFLSTF